jgi:class 3 adenylate cyclase/tetratricopeptide (TPR) repeat protein
MPDGPGTSREVRKTVTVIFCDVVGSTAMGERLDPESVRRVMSLYFDEMRRVIERHDGTVEKFIGDAVMAVFGVPRLHEDDGLRAVRAAHEMRVALGGLNEELSAGWGVTIANRIGVNTGEVVAGEAVADQRLVTGDAINVAARLEQHAGPGDILIGDKTYRLVRDAVTVEAAEPIAAKGKSKPVPAWRLIDVAADAPWLQRHLDSPIVGRETDLAILEMSFAQCLAPATRLVSIVAPAGLGKSRLVREFVQRVSDRARVTHGRCLSYGDGATYWPIAEIVRDLTGVATTDDPEYARSRLLALLETPGAGGVVDTDAQHVADVVAGAVGLSGGRAETREIAWAVRRLLEAAARSGRPLLVVLDDLHWAEPALLDLVEHVVTLAAGVPLMVVCTARPELDEIVPGWCIGVYDARRLTPGPLADGDIDVLLDHLLDGMRLPEPVAARIVAAADGNPLFVEETVRMLVDDGAIVRTVDGWLPTTDLDDMVVPASVTAILASRLERLDPAERTLIQRAAMMGREFYREALEELSGEASASLMDHQLRSLVAKQLVRPVGPGFGGADTFRFFHILTRDAAYASVPKQIRAGLHEQFAGWLEARAGARTPEYEEIIGYHLEQAVRQLRELGRVDVRGRALGARAGQWLSAAGRRSLARDDMSAASNLLERAVELLPEADPERAGLLRDLGTALVARGRFDYADRVLDDAIRFAGATGDLALAELARLDQQVIRLQTDPDGAEGSLTQATDHAFRVFSDQGDDSGLARVWRLRAEVDWMACSYGATSLALDRALTHARRAGVTNEESAISVWFASCLALGPTPAPEAIVRCQDLLLQGSRRVEAAVFVVLGYLSAVAGRPEVARSYLARGKQRHEELGLTFSRAHWTVLSGMALLMTGQAEEAEAELRWGYETLREMGERAGMSTVAAYLARALVALGRYEEAEELTVESEKSAAETDLASQIAWRGTRVPCRLAVGDTATAEGLARAALELARTTDDLELLGYTHAGLAAVLTAQGRDADAAAEATAAAAAYQAKGDVVSAATLEAVPAASDVMGLPPGS